MKTARYVTEKRKSPRKEHIINAISELNEKRGKDKDRGLRLGW